MSEEGNAARRKGGRKLLGVVFEFAPLLLFFLVNGRYGPFGMLAESLAKPLGVESYDITQRALFAGTAVFMAAAAVALPLYRHFEGRWPLMPMIGAFFIVVFGGLTLALHDELFIKMKPTIVNTLFGCILIGGLLFGRSLLKVLLGAAFQLDDAGWKELTKRWAIFFFVLAIVNEVMWRGFSTETWIFSKMAVSMPLTIVFALFQTPLLKRHWHGEDNPFKG